jgi:decaprenylphospho-beta-D-ribofuranose 2-oxidase
MSASLLPLERMAHLSGYGFRSSADAYLYRPTNVEELRELLRVAQDSGRQIVLRGAGRSYGDAAVGNEDIVVDITRMNRILSWDKTTGLIDCEAGVTIEGLWRSTLEDGYWPPIVSGTMFPTLAGALAMNIHGKNNFCAGTLGEHVAELDVLFPNGEFRTLSPSDDLFFSVISSAGLLGIITRVKLKMKKVDSGNLHVLAIGCRNWDEQFETLERFEPDADYMVSWIDCFAGGSRSGRGQIHIAWYGQGGRQFSSTLRPENQDLPDTLMGVVPKSRMWRILRYFNNRPGMRLINWAKYMASSTIGQRKAHHEGLVGFSFLLDYVPNWRNAYLPGGFIQYQSFVPRDKAREVFARQIQMQQEAKLEAFLGVLKRHRPDRREFLFSHALNGYSLALDFKVTEKTWPRLQQLCHDMNEVVRDAGGRFYFAKDSTLRRSDLEPSKVLEYRRLKAALDPDGVLSSNLARRLELDTRPPRG